MNAILASFLCISFGLALRVNVHNKAVEDDDGLPGVTIEPNHVEKRKEVKKLTPKTKCISRMAAAVVKQPRRFQEQVDAMQP